MANSAPLDLSPKNWVATRQRLIAEGSLRYLDLTKFTEAELRTRSYKLCVARDAFRRGSCYAPQMLPAFQKPRFGKTMASYALRFSP
jgi:hypothetical protein